ncbi:glycosyltransferase, partial [Treponema sp. OttesenSCG-928-L16]|nr:glycosyltransferase [Treponema sp. OttesenSCG-928-L16]
FEAIRFSKYKTVALNMKLLFFGNFLANEHFDIIHAHFGPNGLIGAYLKECSVCSRLVVSFHGSDINSYPKRHGADVYKTLYSCADLITANTNFTKDKIVANGCSSEKIKIVPECLIAADYKEVKHDSVHKNSLLTVARLEEKKGYRYALEAAARIKKSIPDIIYYIAGDGSLRDELEELCDALGLRESVKFLGICDNAQVKHLYDICAVFTLPSVTASNGDMEGQGLVIQEAQLCGLPVVTTRHNGIPDGLLENVSGFLVPEKDSAALADKIILLLKDPDLCKQMGEAGKKYVEKKYDIQTISSQLLEYYTEILSNS